MFTDMVGYSALAQRDDELALELLEEHRRLLREIFPRFHGTEVKTIGDGFLVEFQSALDAAQCAIEIQHALSKRNANVPVERRIEIKIGIHIGDVIHRNGDVYGDGVNIASRIEPLAGPGGICVSMDVERQIRNTLEARFQKLAPTELKNISIPMDLFRIILPWEDRAPIVAQPETESIRASRKFLWAAVALCFALMIGVGWWWSERPDKIVTSPAATTDSIAAAQIPAKSVAVLPFENLSRDPDNAYFVEGIQDEILTRLSRIADLKVISRTSTQKYKSAPENLRDVARQLGVANILEGSVQKIANAVHVNVQLIRAATDEHVWAESYNRTLNDVFGVEGEVATAIADQLNAKLTGTEQKAVGAKPTQNTAAYDAYLRGLSLEHNEYSYGAYLQVATDYAEAVRLDPHFALAWARLASVRSFLYFNRIESNTNTAAAVKEAADRAMALAPEAGESWVAQGAYRYRVQRDFSGALAAYEEAQKRLPNNAFVYEYMAYVQRRVGRWQDAEANYKKALELDPRDIQLLSSMGNEFYNYLRRFDDALAMLDRALEISPDSEQSRANKANVLLAAGRLHEAAEELDHIPPNSTEDWVVAVRVIQALYERRYDAVIQIAERRMNATTAGQPVDGFAISALADAGYCYAWTGRSEEARRAFARVINELQPTPDTVVPADAND